ncbi:HEPN domain-containing protein [Legionella pneumophila serogroup 1]
MPLNPRKLLSVAHDILHFNQANEEHYRSASGRAYYCAFHECSAVAISQLQIAPQNNPNFGHKELFNVFLNHQPTLKVLTSRDRDINYIGYLLKQTRDLRVHADYKVSSFSKQQAMDSIKNTEEILNLIQKL